MVRHVSDLSGSADSRHLYFLCLSPSNGTLLASPCNVLNGKRNSSKESAMRRVFAGAMVFVMCAIGCQSSQTSDAAPKDDQKGRIKVRAPGVDVDIERTKS